MISDDDKQAYAKNGVICLRDIISDHWLDVSRQGIKQSIANPGRFFRDYTQEGSPGRYTFEYWNWWNIKAFEDLALKSHLGALIGELTGAQKVTLLMDQWFQREAGSTNAANWHHDEPYFDFFGGQKTILWFPLEDTKAEDGLTLLPGSHKWGKLFTAQNFGKREAFEGHGKDYEPVPDLSAFEDQCVSWDMKAGDCLIFDFRTLHRATSDQAVTNRTGQRISYRYGDENVTFAPRGAWTSETSAFLMEAGQKPNAPLDCKYLPTVFER